MKDFFFFHMFINGWGVREWEDALLLKLVFDDKFSRKKHSLKFRENFQFQN